jgi:hypothetical protein
MYIRFIKTFGRSISETATRPNPSAAHRGRTRWLWLLTYVKRPSLVPAASLWSRCPHTSKPFGAVDRFGESFE